MSYKKSLIAVLLLFLLALTACQWGRSDETEKVSFMVFGDPAEYNAYVNLVDAFHQAHPEIRVELTHVPSPREYRTRLVTEFTGGAPPDVTLMNYRRYASFAANNLLEPVGPYLDKSAVIQPEDFYEVTLDAFTWQGTLMCLPQNISSLVVYYNQDLFDEAGLPYPADDWNWDDFVATAVALTKDNDGDGIMDQHGLGVEPTLFRLAPFVWQNSAPIVDDQVRPTRLTLGRFPSLQAFQWFVDLYQVHGVVPGRVEEASQDSESRFIAGTTAMYLNSRRGTPTYREITGFTWDIAPLPQHKVAAGILHSDAYCLSSTTANKDAAWTFIEYANSVEGQTIVAASGRTVPSLKAVAESPAFLEPDLPPARSRVFLDTIPALQLVPVVSTWQEIESTADQEIERAFYGDISTEEAASLMFQRTEEYFLLADFATEP
ncbi:MAG TPA: sugar ABC transporter substrate-binding protein [Chloroflexota bacterium]|nr:sugar ABC transporter substrate-binding protein [Chloroflexota bacterium]HUM69754.1 sugar ABC transporter substrate-binding protein [Chloroflexota bacterium]